MNTTPEKEVFKYHEEISGKLPNNYLGSSSRHLNNSCYLNVKGPNIYMGSSGICVKVSRYFTEGFETLLKSNC